MPTEKDRYAFNLYIKLWYFITEKCKKTQTPKLNQGFRILTHRNKLGKGVPYCLVRPSIHLVITRTIYPV